MQQQTLSILHRLQQKPAAQNLAYHPFLKIEPVQQQTKKRTDLQTLAGLTRLCDPDLAERFRTQPVLQMQQQKMVEQVTKVQEQNSYAQYKSKRDILLETALVDDRL